MNISRLPGIFLACSALALPCSATPEGQTIYTAKHKETAEKLAVQQDELQADTSDLIMGETNEEVIDLLKKCRHAMNDAVDLLENYNTGGPTLAAQSDVIELIYLAAKARMSMPGGGAGGKLPKFGENGMKPGSEALERGKGKDRARARTAGATSREKEPTESRTWLPPRKKGFPAPTRRRKAAPSPNPPGCPQMTCPPNSARRWTPTTEPSRSSKR